MVVRRNGEERVSCGGGGGRGGVRIERRGEPGGWWRVDQRSWKCRGGWGEFVGDFGAAGFSRESMQKDLLAEAEASVDGVPGEDELVLMTMGLVGGGEEASLKVIKGKQNFP